MSTAILNCGAQDSQEPGTPKYGGFKLENSIARVVDPLTGPEWDQLVLSHPEATPFHSSAWAKVLVKTYHHTPFYLHCIQQGQSLALVPLMEVQSRITGRRGVCLPFSDYCGPLLYPGCRADEAYPVLATLARERQWRRVEIRERPSHAELGAVPSSITYFGHVLDLRKHTDELFDRFSSSVRRAVRKAEKSGLEIEISESQEALAEFCRLHVRTRRRHGVPPQPMCFFRFLHEEILQKGLGFVVLARHRTRCVAAALFLRFGRAAIYKFGASDSAAQGLRGNDLVMWEGIRFLAKTGCDSLHLGRTSFDNPGLRRFKLGWGTAEEMISYYRWKNPEGWESCRNQGPYWQEALFSRMPLFLNQMAGSLLYPHLD